MCLLGLRYNRDTEKKLDNSGLSSLYAYFNNHRNIIKYCKRRLL